MGKQLALLCAFHKMEVVVWNHKLNLGFEKDFDRLIRIESRLGNISKEAINDVRERVRHVDNISAIAACDLFIEAVKEIYEVKLHVLTLLADTVDESKIISSNTSTLSITDLASLLPNPSRFLGTHFFNPLMSMKLVEVIKGKHTSEEVVSFVIQFLTEMKRQPYVFPETPGFIVNRLLFSMINEAIYMFSQGLADAKTIDSCMKLGANHPMGPLELADFIGLDVCLNILNTLVDRTGNEKYCAAPLLKEYVYANKLGRKTGSGFYSYAKKVS